MISKCWFLELANWTCKALSDNSDLIGIKCIFLFLPTMSLKFSPFPCSKLPAWPPNPNKKKKKFFYFFYYYYFYLFKKQFELNEISKDPNKNYKTCISNSPLALLLLHLLVMSPVGNNTHNWLESQADRWFRA